MHRRREEEEEEEERLYLLYWTTGQMMPDTSENRTPMVSFAEYIGDYLKATLKTPVVEEAPEPQHDSITSLCNYCGKGFKSSKALAGHLRIHSQNHVKHSKPHPMIDTPREHSPEEEDGASEPFSCLTCTESFSTFHSLGLHTAAVHRHGEPNPVPRPVLSQESSSEITFKQGIDRTVSVIRNDRKIDLPKADIKVNGPSQTSQRGLKRTARDDDIIEGPVAPLRVYAYSQMETRKKKTEESMGYQGISMDNKSKSRRSRKKAKAVKRQVHQCEICDKIFESGQALGGHKTKHRVKELLPQQTHLSEEAADQNRPKRMLDFDLNIPYQE